MMTYNKEENNEPLILRSEDWTDEEYNALRKVFGCPEGTTRIKVQYNAVEWFENLKQVNNQDVEELAKYLDNVLSSPGYSDYILNYLGEALDVARHGNCLLDLDNIVHLKKVLGFNISYELYGYIDSQYDYSLLEVEDKNELMQHVWNYLGKKPFTVQ